MADTKNILLVGVGGQGTILASKVLSAGLIQAGYDVKMSEIHGMSQRGGSVSTQIRYGEKINSPIIGLGQADILVAFEKMEALRWLDHLKVDGKIVVNKYEIPSMPILIGKKDYPQGVVERIEKVSDATFVEAADLAKNIGNIKAMNIVLLGALVKAMELTEIDWNAVISSVVKEKFVELNLKAFQLGIEAI